MSALRPLFLIPYAPPRLLPLHRHSRRALHENTTLRSRSDLDGLGYTSAYEPGKPTEGPLSRAQSPRTKPKTLTPAALKKYVDKFVVGQDKAKKVTCVAIFNHYQRVSELQRQLENEEEERDRKEGTWSYIAERRSHPVEGEYVNHPYIRYTPSHDSTSETPPPDEFPGHTVTLHTANLKYDDARAGLGNTPLDELDAKSNRTMIEKSNLLLLGPSGVGKTLILQTLARVLEVPFASVDCSSLTQAGYIGTDIESSIERLLLASEHSVEKCETGIIFLDEVDKLAKPAIMTHGRDVSGEGVQQGLLKIIEGTTVTVNAKSDKSSSFKDRGRDQGPKSEQYTIDTSNILFVFAGAFVGLERIISSRLATASTLGFNSVPPVSSASKNIPPSDILQNVLHGDLQSYGIIPELLGRIPIITTLRQFKLAEMVSILTEPKNSLIRQYTALFSTYGGSGHGITLKFTHLALEAIANIALHGPDFASKSKDGRQKGGGVGARALRAILEKILHEVMFIGPSSPSIRFCLIDEEFVLQHSSSSRTASKEVQESEDDEGHSQLPRCWPKNQKRSFEEAFENEEQAWRDKQGGVARNFQEFRKQEAGSGM